MFPPVSTIPTRRPRKRSGSASNAAKPGGAGTLDDELLTLDQQLDRGFQLSFGDEANGADQFGDDPPGQLPRLLDRDPLGQGRALGSAAPGPCLAARDTSTGRAPTARR